MQSIEADRILETRLSNIAADQTELADTLLNAASGSRNDVFVSFEPYCEQQ